MRTHDIQPVEPNQNAYMERFKHTHRAEVLNAYLVADLDQVRELPHRRLINYNEERPHDSLGVLPPVAYAKAAGNSNFKLST